MPRIGRPLLFPILASMAACATFAFPPGQAFDELSAMARPAFPPFKGTGSLALETGHKKFSGLIYLALQDEMFSLEITDASGRTIMAAVGSSTRVEKLDMATGKREVFSGGIPLFGDISAPAELIKIMVTGAPPLFGSVRSAWMERGMKAVSVSSPDMAIYYQAGKVAKVKGGTGPMAYELTIGPMAPGPMAEYAESAQITLQGARIFIRWEKVWQGLEFAPGQFNLGEGTLEFE